MAIRIPPKFKPKTGAAAMLPYTNMDRVADAHKIVMHFSRQSGMDPDPQGHETAVGDLISNLLHWVANNAPAGKLAALKCVQQGISNYVSESYVDYAAEEFDELGLDATVTIYVDCNDEHWCTDTGAPASIGPAG